MVVLASGEWRSPPLLLAVAPAERLAGIRRAPPGTGLLVRSRSVRGLRSPLGVIALDDTGRVLAVRLLRPGGLVVVSGAAWIAEVPPVTPLPAPGTPVVPMLAPCPAA
jgi:hypothetical protein